MYTYSVSSVVKVVDGDTVDVDIDLGFGIIIRQRVRLKGINAPETRTTDFKEKSLGILSKYFLEKELSNCKNLRIQTYKDDKYGRILGVLFDEGESVSINQKMIDYNFAEPFM